MDGLFTISPEFLGRAAGSVAAGDRIAGGPAAGDRAAGILFAEDFDAPHSFTPHAFTPPAKPRPTCTAAELETARATAYAEGREIGFAEATTQHEAALTDATRALAGKLVALRHDAADAAERAATALARLFLDSLAALFPALCAQHGAAEAAAVLRAVLPGLGGEPGLRLSANPAILPGLAAELARLDPALAARTSLTPSEMLIPGDVILAWQHGTATRDAATLWHALAAALAPSGLMLPPLPESTDAR